MHASPNTELRPAAERVLNLFILKGCLDLTRGIAAKAACWAVRGLGRMEWRVSPSLQPHDRFLIPHNLN
ncbi:hypothetical protein BpHYR1_041866 [Brachionus plicatilis]|uniref:Uncharacterized protein n=1 Tax=Brachionus plicatilis TaxID=10195 RepID=A0A3M7RCS9_BRAPC|nr:hypothetical protein BpHYR1_041866 [Brachionus plicatilis]